MFVFVRVPQRNETETTGEKKLYNTHTHAKQVIMSFIVTMAYGSGLSPRTNRADGVSSIPSLNPRQGKTNVLAQRQEEKKNSFLTFYSIYVFNRLDEAHPQGGRQSTLFSLPIQMLVLSRDTLTDPPRNNVWPTIWAPCGPFKLGHKINHQYVDEHLKRASLGVLIMVFQSTMPLQNIWSFKEHKRQLWLCFMFWSSHILQQNVSVGYL